MANGGNTKKGSGKKTEPPAEEEVCAWKGAGLMSEAGPFEFEDPPQEPPQVPEPDTLALLGLGLLGLGFSRRPALR